MLTEEVTKIVDELNELMDSENGLNNIKLPALKEVIENTKLTNDITGYSKHSDHSKTSTGGCAMGCLGG